jgi:hypothetical protein
LVQVPQVRGALDRVLRFGLPLLELSNQSCERVALAEVDAQAEDLLM